MMNRHGQSLPAASIISKPLYPGMTTSVMTTSGARRSMQRSPSRPSDASPTISQSSVSH